MEMAGTSNMASSRLHSMGKNITGGQSLIWGWGWEKKRKEEGIKGDLEGLPWYLRLRGAVIMTYLILFLTVMKLIISKYWLFFFKFLFILSF